ncbi:non-structural maintenance of chromosomes element protein A [Trifolium repens]|nr:non-structural maintenance of chromosomes element protein A [Trifolium repens]
MAHKGNNNNKEIEEDERTFRRLKRERIKANENVAEEFDSSSGIINICSEFLKLKSLINEKKDDLMNIDSDRFYSILHEFNKLHEQVMRPREHVVDAEALVDLTHTLAESVK